MKTVFESLLYFCAVLEEGDADIYVQMKRLMRDDYKREAAPSLLDRITPPALKRQFAARAERLDQQDWLREFQGFKDAKDMDRRVFCLFKKNGDRRPSLVGISEIEIIPSHHFKFPDVTFCGSYILKEHRGRRLADHFYQARTAYAVQNTLASDAFVEIHPQNMASQHAAQRNGFRFWKRDFGLLKRDIHIYGLDLAALRRSENELDFSMA